MYFLMLPLLFPFHCSLLCIIPSSLGYLGRIRLTFVRRLSSKMQFFHVRRLYWMLIDRLRSMRTSNGKQLVN